MAFSLHDARIPVGKYGRLISRDLGFLHWAEVKRTEEVGGWAFSQMEAVHDVEDVI